MAVPVHPTSPIPPSRLSPSHLPLRKGGFSGDPTSPQSSELAPLRKGSCQPERLTEGSERRVHRPRSARRPFFPRDRRDTPSRCVMRSSRRVPTLYVSDPSVSAAPSHLPLREGGFPGIPRRRSLRKEAPCSSISMSTPNTASSTGPAASATSSGVPRSWASPPSRSPITGSCTARSISTRPPRPPGSSPSSGARSTSRPGPASTGTMSAATISPTTSCCSAATRPAIATSAPSSAAGSPRASTASPASTGSCSASTTRA